jgi:transcriptional regulator with PAS, ATPase and Fis domain
MHRVLSLATRIAPRSTTVIITGESGTGKDVLARFIHAHSRRPGRFVPINCAALPEALVESELFGYRRGAFTGAHTDKPGLLAVGGPEEARKSGPVFGQALVARRFVSVCSATRRR